MGYTDASIGMENTGCSVCNISCNQNFLFKIPAVVSSLTGELHSIDKAIDLIIEDGFSTAAILTDSKNACHLLTNNSTHNHLVNTIIRKINNSLIEKIKIIWTPSHVGILPNETADYFARHAMDFGCPIVAELSASDALNQIEKALWNEWAEDYKNISISKGAFFFQFFPQPSKVQWHKNFIKSPAKIKLINRLFAGHSYCKNYLYKMGIHTTNICDTCNVVEDENHLIFNCGKYSQFRNHHYIFKKFTNLTALLKTKNFNYLDDLTNFMNRSKIEI